MLMLRSDASGLYCEATTSPFSPLCSALARVGNPLKEERRVTHVRSGENYVEEKNSRDRETFRESYVVLLYNRENWTFGSYDVCLLENRYSSWYIVRGDLRPP